ncbi:MAG: SH3 domain-containing protein [Anaerolineae bacterium]
MKRFLFLLSLTALLALAVVPVFAQEPPVVFNQAVADLSARSGRTLTTDDFANYAWAQDIYPDTSFGCPVPPADVRSGPVSGYLVTITFEGVTYDYRGSADGSFLFLCGQSGEGAPVGSTAAPPASATADCPTGYVGYLQPRLTVGGQARVSGTEFPNRLRSAPTTSAQQIGLLNPGTTMSVIGGPSCADTFVWWQVRAGDLTGWTAEGAPPDEYFLEPVGGVGTPLTPKPGVMPQVANDQSGVVTQWTLDATGLVPAGQLAAVPMTDNGTIAQVVFSPDGTKVAFRVVDYTDSSTITRLYVADAVSGAQPQMVADNLFTEMPVSFTPEGELLYAVMDSTRESVGTPDPTLGGATVVVQAFRQALTPGAVPEPVHSFNFGLGCGGGWSYPAVGAYWVEAGYGGRPLALLLTDDSLIYSTNCTGSGVNSYSFSTSETQTLGDNLSRVALSPDGTQLAGVQDGTDSFATGTVTIVDLASGALSTIPTEGSIDRVAWTPEGQLATSSAADTGEPIPGTMDEAFVSMGFNAGIPARQVTISALDPETKAETVIYTGPGYMVGKLLPLPGGDLLFTVIPAGEDWVAAVSANGIPADTTANELFDDYFEPEIMRLPVGGIVDQIGAGFQTTTNPPAFAAG